jgi:phage terminase large subunit-like protein
MYAEPAEYVPAIHTPPKFDIDGLLGEPVWELMEFAHYRRMYCEYDPLLFALIYLEHHLISDETGGKDIHLSQMHLDMAESAKQMVRRDFMPAEERHVWVGPRDSGKSTWACQPIIVLWAMAYGHREVIACFTANDTAAARLMSCIRRELSENERLRHDFPDLVKPAKNVNNRTVSDTQNMFTAANGVTVFAYGIDSNQLGAKIENKRPKLIMLEDVEPDEGNYSEAQVTARLATIRNAVLPMNDRAVVWWVGTVTMFGSAVHDLVRTALGDPIEWVVEDEWKVHYYAPIVIGPDGEEESCWEAKWPITYLQSIRHRRTFALNFRNNPRSVEHGLWTPGDIVVVENAPISDQVLSIDPAVTSKTTSDPFGLAVTTWGARIIVEWAEEMHLTPEEFKVITLRLLADNPMIRRVVVETNQGGEHWADILWPSLPTGIELIEVWHSKNKPGRFAHLLDFYQEDKVAHAGHHQTLVRQMLMYPKIAHDDVIDAVAIGVEEHLQHLWGKTRARTIQRKRTR